jgi:hypothetical protein
MQSEAHNVLSAPHDHVVSLYDRDADIVAEVSRYVAEGLRGDATVFVVATAAHRAAFDATLIADGIDVADAELSGRYVCLDAAETLASFMVDGSPDRGRFREVVGGLIADAEATGRPVRAFGEMVALLWEAGDVTGAIELEDHWNDLARAHRFSLYCAYPIAALEGSDDLVATGQVCTYHSEVLVPPSYATGMASLGLERLTERSRVFVPVPGAIKAVRRFVCETFAAWSRQDVLDEAAIVASELATNAVRYSDTAFRVVLERGSSSVRIAVHDGSASLPVRRHPGAHEPNGRGIALIERMSAVWGAELVGGGKVVWADLDAQAL